MFKELRRIKQKLDIEESKEILSNTLRGVLSLNGLDGYPYGIPLNHYYSKEDNRLYFHSGKIGYKIDCINNDNKCSYCVLNDGDKSDNHWSLIFKSVIVFGKIKFVNDIKEIERISRLLSYKFTSNDKEIDKEIELSLNNTKLFYIDIEYIIGKLVNER